MDNLHIMDYECLVTNFLINFYKYINILTLCQLSMNVKSCGAQVIMDTFSLLSTHSCIKQVLPDVVIFLVVNFSSFC